MTPLVQAQIEDLRQSVKKDMEDHLGYEVDVVDSTNVGDMVHFRLRGLNRVDLSRTEVQDVFNASFNHHLARVSGMGSDN